MSSRSQSRGFAGLKLLLTRDLSGLMDVLETIDFLNVRSEIAIKVQQKVFNFIRVPVHNPAGKSTLINRIIKPEW